MKLMFTFIFLLATNYMLIGMEPVYVACKTKGCSFRCKNDPNLIQAHENAHKQTGNEVYHCDECDGWAYTNTGLRAHKRKKHPTNTQPNNAYPPKASSMNPARLPSLSYRAFCTLESRINPEYAEVKRSYSAINKTVHASRFHKEPPSYETIFCECCQQFVNQHSYKEHVFLWHPELYNFNHLTLVKTLQMDLHPQDF